MTQLCEHLQRRGEIESLAGARNKRGNPYPAEFESIDGIRWQGSIHCGHNPSLHARLVHNLRVVVHDDGSLATTWDERPCTEPPIRTSHG